MAGKEKVSVVGKEEVGVIGKEEVGVAGKEIDVAGKEEEVSVAVKEGLLCSSLGCVPFLTGLDRQPALVVFYYQQLDMKISYTYEAIEVASEGGVGRVK